VEYPVKKTLSNGEIIKEQHREFLSFDWLKEKQAQIIGKENSYE
jgi:hypothetical protein